MDVLDDCIRSEEKKYCCTCKWYAEFEGVCCNGDSEYRGDFRNLDDTCVCWENIEEIVFGNTVHTGRRKLNNGRKKY